MRLKFQTSVECHLHHLESADQFSWNSVWTPFCDKRHFTEAVFTLKFRTVLQYSYARKCNLRGNCTEFHAAIFAKLKNAQQRYVRIVCTKFHSSRTINVENTYKNVFMPVSTASRSLRLFSQISQSPNIFLWTYCPKFCPNRMKIVAHPYTFSFTLFSTLWFSISAPIITKLATAQWNYVGISYTKFNPNGSVSVRSRVELHLRS
jgi:hypothetical protein